MSAQRESVLQAVSQDAVQSFDAGTVPHSPSILRQSSPARPTRRQILPQSSVPATVLTAD
jgi:hypothetical protein